MGLQKPLYERRRALIAGQAVPTPEEIEAGVQYSQKDEENYTSPVTQGPPHNASAIPEFWLTALRNHVGLNDIITDRDANALKHLIDIRLDYLDNESNSDMKGKPGFKILFVFSKNEFFENEILEKTYVYQDEVGYSGDFVYDRAIGTEIRWNEDQDLTKEFEIKKQRNKSESMRLGLDLCLTSMHLATNRTRLVRKSKPTDSFFNFFSPPQPPSDDALESGELDEEELEEIESKLEVDYQIGEDFKEKVRPPCPRYVLLTPSLTQIVPRAIDYFTGKALDYDMMEEDEEDYEDVDEDDDEFEDEVCMSWIFALFDDKAYWLTGAGVGWR